MSSPKSSNNKLKRKKTDDSEELRGFPTTLEGFNYEFKDGRLLHKETGEKFNFQVSEYHSYNQRHYEALGEVITEHVYQLLVDDVKLERRPIPASTYFNPNKKQAKGFIFVSEKYEEAEKLLVLVHGSGVVKAGQWARRLIINDCLDHGTQLPYIRRGLQDNYGIVVLNTNQNEVLVKGRKMFIEGSQTPMEHFNHVWKHYVEKAKAAKIFIVAHSYGGYLVVDYLVENQGAIDKVTAVAFTDSVHSLNYQTSRQTYVQEWFKKNSINWVTSTKDLDKPMNSDEYFRRSAGTTIHEETSWKAMESIFTYFKNKIDSPGEAKSNRPVDHGQKQSGSPSKVLVTLLELASQPSSNDKVAPCSSQTDISDGITSQGETNDSGGTCSASGTNDKIADDEKSSQGGTNCDNNSHNSEGDTNDGAGTNTTSGSASGSGSENVGVVDKSSHSNSDNSGDGANTGSASGRSDENVGNGEISHGGATGGNIGDGSEDKTNGDDGANTGSASGRSDENVGNGEISHGGAAGGDIGDGSEDKTNGDDGANTGSASGRSDENVGNGEISHGGATGGNIGDVSEDKTNGGDGANTGGANTGSVSGRSDENVGNGEISHDGATGGNIGDGSEDKTNDGDGANTGGANTGGANTGSVSGRSDENVGNGEISHDGATGGNIGDGSEDKTNGGANTGSASGRSDENVGNGEISHGGATGGNIGDGSEDKTNGGDGANTGSASGRSDENVGNGEISHGGATGCNIGDSSEDKTNGGGNADTGSASEMCIKNVGDDQETHGGLNNDVGDSSDGNTDLGGENVDTGIASRIGDEQRSNGGTTSDNVGGESQDGINDGDVEDAHVYSPSETGGNNSEKCTSGTNGEQVGGSSQVTTGGKSNGSLDENTNEENNGKVSSEDKETSEKLNEKNPCGGNESGDDKSNSSPPSDGQIDVKDNGCASTRSLAGTDDCKAGARTSIPGKPTDDKTTTHQEKVESKIPHESENLHVKTEGKVALNSGNQDEEKSKL